MIKVCVACAMTACSGPSSTSDGGSDSGVPPAHNEVEGDLGFDVGAGRRILNRRPGGGLDTRDRVQVLLESRELTDLCRGIGAPGPLEFLALEVRVRDGGAVTPGTYPVTTSDPAAEHTIWYGNPELDGGPVTTQWPLIFADAGSITLSRADDAGAAGSFSASFFLRDGGVAQVQGTFDVPSLLCE